MCAAAEPRETAVGYLPISDEARSGGHRTDPADAPRLPSLYLPGLVTPFLPPSPRPDRYRPGRGRTLPAPQAMGVAAIPTPEWMRQL